MNICYNEEGNGAEETDYSVILMLTSERYSRPLVNLPSNFADMIQDDPFGVHPCNERKQRKQTQIIYI